MRITRRTSLKALLGAGCAIVLPKQISAESATTQSDRLILSAPLTHSDWMLKPGMTFDVAGVRHMLDACKACGWSEIYWRTFDGGRAMYASKIAAPGDNWDADSFWSPANPADQAMAQRMTAGVTPEKRKELLDRFKEIDYSKFDALAAAVDHGHQIGLKIHAWVTVNEDDHGWGLQSTFSKQNPQFRWVKRDGTPYHSQLSFAFKEVRDYKLSILSEILDSYPVDGLFLDWIRTGDVRDNPQTDSAGVADSGYEAPLIKAFQDKFGVDPHSVPNDDDRWVRTRAEPQTIFMRSVRELTRSRPRNIPVAIVVQHPWGYRGELDKIAGNLKGLLLDVNSWAREGLIDAAVAAGYYRDGGTPQMAYKSLRDDTEGKIDIWAYSWVPQTPDEFLSDFRLAQTEGADHILFWEADYIDSRPNAAALKQIMSQHARV